MLISIAPLSDSALLYGSPSSVPPSAEKLGSYIKSSKPSLGFSACYRFAPRWVYSFIP
jgi:hypothetical protein